VRRQLFGGLGGGQSRCELDCDEVVAPGCDGAVVDFATMAARPCTAGIAPLWKTASLLK
jgi:hypothetical protein